MNKNYLTDGNKDEFISFVKSLQEKDYRPALIVKELEKAGWVTARGTKITRPGRILRNAEATAKEIEKERKSLAKSTLQTIEIDSDDSEIEIIAEHQEIVNEIKKNREELDHEAKINLCLAYTRSMDSHWKNCVEYKKKVIEMLKSAPGENFRSDLTNRIYWDENCQDLDVSWFFNHLLGYDTIESMMDRVIPIKNKCISNNCSNPVFMNSRKDIYLKRCKHHEWWYQYNNYLNSDEWKIKSKKIMERDGNRCRCCSATEELSVHHNTYERLKNEDDLDLITLCNFCHLAITEKAREKKNILNESKKKV